MSVNRYMITIRDTRNTKELHFKMKATVGRTDQFLEEIKEHTNWESLIKSYEAKEGRPEVDPAIALELQNEKDSLR
jgi:hypothetical protein